MAGLTYRFAFVGSASDKVFVTKVVATSDLDIQDILEAAARKFKLPAEHSGLLDIYPIHGVELASLPSKAQCDEALTYPRVNKLLRPSPELFPADAWYLIVADSPESLAAAPAVRAAASMSAHGGFVLCRRAGFKRRMLPCLRSFEFWVWLPRAS